MADYAPNYTARYRVRYSVADTVHSMTIRPDADQDDAAAIAGAGAAVVTDVLTAMSSMLSTDFTILGADVAVVNSDVFLPAATLPVGVGTAGSDLDSGWKPMNVSFVGRSTTGGRAIFHLYGVAVNPFSGETTQNDWRITSTEDGRIEDTVDVLNTGGPRLLANDGAGVVFYPYANINANAYWQKRARRG